MFIWNGFLGLLEQLLLFCAQLTGSVGFGIILFTIFARVAILPLTLSSIRSSRKMQEIQPQIKEIQRKYGKDQQKLQEETMRLYREMKINPVGGCLPIFLQLPIFLGVYQAVSHLMVPSMNQYLSEASKITLADPAVAKLFATPFLGLIELGKASWGPDPLGFNGAIYLILPVLSIMFQFLQQLMATPRVQDPQQKAMMQTMMFLPFVFGYISFTFPSGAVLYWVTSSIVGIIQQYFTSGWGSLANYLKFLPPDGKPAPSLTPALASVSSSGGDISTNDEPTVATPRQDFWSVLKPLTELETSPRTPAAMGAEQGGSDPVSDAIDEARTQGQMRNPRRIRRRR
jgi:YidC/Oxa1 family membrane protein insertase